MEQAKEILDRHLKSKNATNEHIHVAAYMAAWSAVNEAIGVLDGSCVHPFRNVKEVSMGIYKCNLCNQIV